MTDSASWRSPGRVPASWPADGRGLMGCDRSPNPHLTAPSPRPGRDPLVSEPAYALPGMACFKVVTIVGVRRSDVP